MHTVPIDATIQFLIALLNTPSPVGYHLEAIPYVRQAFEALAIPELRFDQTRKGGLVITWPRPAPAEERYDSTHTTARGLTAHVDTLGAMVKTIKPSGRLQLTQLGSYMWNAVEWEGVTVRTADDRRLRGTILPANPSTHVNRDIATALRTEALMEVRLDARTTSAAETRALGIEVGDFVFLDPRVEVGEAGFIRSRHLDDKASVASIYGAFMALRDAGQHPATDIHALISNYEEVGHGGAHGYPTELAELVAVDMAAIGDGQNSDEYHCTICAKDSSGPYHIELTAALRQLARENSIEVKVDTYPFYSSDGSAYWRAGGDTKVALIGPGVDASHAYERTHRDAIRDTASLIAAWMMNNI